MKNETNEQEQQEVRVQSILIRRPGAFAAVVVPLSLLSFLWIQAPTKYLFGCALSGLALGTLVVIVPTPKNTAYVWAAVFLLCCPNKLLFSGLRIEWLPTLQGLLVFIASAALLALLTLRRRPRARDADDSPALRTNQDTNG